MVTVVVILVLSGGAMAAFLKFNRTQTIVNDARQLVAEINRVRSLAVGLQYPNGCVTLKGYNIKSVLINGSLAGVTVTALCSPGDIVSPPSLLLNSSEFNSAFDITFAPESGYLTTGADAEIIIRDNIDATVTKKVTVGVYGTITLTDNNQDGGWRWI